MPLTHTLGGSLNDGSSVYSWTEDVSAGQAYVLDESIPGSSTDLVLATVINKDKLKSIEFWADRPMDLYTNAASGGAYGKRITLVANVHYRWSLANGYFALPFDASITALYVTLAAGAASILHGRGIIDPS